MELTTGPKIAGLLILFALVLGLLVWGPMSGGEPDRGPDIQTPSMQNIPEGKQLTIEVNDDQAPASKKAE